MTYFYKFFRWILGAGMMSALLVGLGTGASRLVAQRTADARGVMVASLASRKPHASLGDEARTFDRLVGAWDCDFGFFQQDGTVRHSPGELLFGWIIDGRALQDLWIGYPSDGSKERTIGTSIRFFDTQQKTWRVVFISPQYNYIMNVQGGAEGDRIVLHGVSADGAAVRWSFNDIKPNSFVWRGEKSRDGGKTWKLEEEHHMARRTGSHP